jgi:hypothetical protein
MGLNSVQIANYLNERGILTPSGKMYYPKLVWVTHNKFKHRAIRSLTIDMELNDMRYTLLARR